LLLHEIGGVTPETLELGERLSNEGYTVYVPVLFGKVGERKPAMLARCRSHDFNCLSDSASPLARELLDKLLPRIAARHTKIGVIGMCLTGSFPLLLVQHDAVKAAVVSQPALPLFRKSAVGLSAEEIAATRTALEPKAKVLYFRYSRDCISPNERLEALKKELPGRVESRVFPACTSEHHAVLTDSLTETPEAWKCLTAYLAESLQGKAVAPGACVSQEELDREDLSARCGQVD
jgi:dienelactone hydrolase